MASYAILFLFQDGIFRHPVFSINVNNIVSSESILLICRRFVPDDS